MGCPIVSMSWWVHGTTFLQLQWLSSWCCIQATFRNLLRVNRYYHLAILTIMLVIVFECCIKCAKNFLNHKPPGISTGLAFGTPCYKINKFWYNFKSVYQVDFSMQNRRTSCWRNQPIVSYPNRWIKHLCWLFTNQSPLGFWTNL